MRKMDKINKDGNEWMREGGKDSLKYKIYDYILVTNQKMNVPKC